MKPLVNVSTWALPLPPNFLTLGLHVYSEEVAFPSFFLLHSCLEYCFPY